MKPILDELIGGDRRSIGKIVRQMNKTTGNEVVAQ